MAASQDHISAATPMGANIIPGEGATFRLWAPGALQVHVALGGKNDFRPGPASELVKDSAGHWTGFFPGVQDGTKYRFFVVGPGGEGLKRDPYARELEFGDYPECDCLVRDPEGYRWHDARFRPPAFRDLIVYQFHIGVFYARDSSGNDIRKGRVSKFLDALDRIEYLADLGVTALQPLPIDEYQTKWSLGYNMTDIFSPEMDYCAKPEEIPNYLPRINELLGKKGFAPLVASDITAQIDQLKLFIDLCHVYDLAVILDVVYNHGGGGFDAQSIHHIDFPANPDNGNSIYFSGEYAGGLVYNFQRPEVRQFLIDHATHFFREYHVDGFRFDEVSAIDNFGGWFFCQDLNGTLGYEKPQAFRVAEYWKDFRWLAVWDPPAGMGFAAAYADGIRDTVRKLIQQAAAGAGATVNLDWLKAPLERPYNFPQAWQAYNCVENHDFVLDADGDHRKPRIAKLSDWNDPRSVYARGRSRVATGLLLGAPGIPLLFMGQEFLEDKLWCDSPENDGCFIWWEGAEGADRHMEDFLRFARDMVWLRRRYPALRSEAINVFNMDAYNRILAFHRWVPEGAEDLVVVVSLREEAFYDHSYRLGFPFPGQWHEVFNSDYYDMFPNPGVQGNPGGVAADGPPWQGLDHSAGITIPMNSVLVFARS